jgi:hypothetical protein
MPWIGAVLGLSAEHVIPRLSKVSTYMTLRLLPPSMSTLERRFDHLILYLISVHHQSSIDLSRSSYLLMPFIVWSNKKKSSYR